MRANRKFVPGGTSLDIQTSGDGVRHTSAPDSRPSSGRDISRQPGRVSGRGTVGGTRAAQPGAQGAYRMERSLAITLLEVTKWALDQMCQWRLTLSNGGKPCSGQWARLSGTYGQTRRLRTYLESCTNDKGSEVTLALDDEDANLLVSCIGHYVRNPVVAGVDGEEPAELDPMHQTLISAAVELATREFADLPLPKGHAVPSRAFWELQNRVLEKTRRREQQLSAGLGSSVPDSQSCVPESHETEPRSDELPLLDEKAIRNPKLRELASLDLRALQRAQHAEDHRLVTLHLFSILEVALFDFTLRRRKELGLAGVPGSWNMKAIAQRVLGADASEEDSRALNTICVAGKLIRPIEQYCRPVSVTASDSRAQLRVVATMLGRLGYRAGAVSEPCAS